MSTLFSYTSLAEEPKSLILFRDIPWTSNMPSVFSALEGISFSTPRQDYAGDVAYNLLEGGSIKFDDYVTAEVYATKLNGLKVAGYELSGLSLSFAYTADESGLLSKDEEHTAFVYAKYEIKPKDIDFVMSDLFNKLTKTYGDAAGHRTTGSIIAYEIYYWIGDDDTIVSLVGGKYSSGSDEVTIRYSFYGADDLYQQAMDALAYEELLNADENDTSGL